MSTVDDTTVTVSTEAIHSLAQEMDEKVISAQKTEVDQMVKEAESYVAKIKNGMLLDKAILDQGQAKGDYTYDEDITRLHIKRAKVTLKGVSNIGDLETLLERVKKEQKEYEELIEQFRKFCDKMHGSADEIDEEVAGLLEEIDLILGSDEQNDEEDDDELSDPDKPNKKTSSEESDEEIELPNISEKPLPTDVEKILAEIASEIPTSTKIPTEIPTVTTPSATPTETPTPTETEPPVTTEPPVVNNSGGYSGYSRQAEVAPPAPVEAPPTIDNIVQGRVTAKIPTSSAPIARATPATKSSGSAVFTSATTGVASAAVLGLGAKAYLDKKKAQEEENDAEKQFYESILEKQAYQETQEEQENENILDIQ